MSCYHVTQYNHIIKLFLCNAGVFCFRQAKAGSVTNQQLRLQLNVNTQYTVYTYTLYIKRVSSPVILLVYLH